MKTANNCHISIKGVWGSNSIRVSGGGVENLGSRKEFLIVTSEEVLGQV